MQQFKKLNIQLLSLTSKSGSNKSSGSTDQFYKNIAMATAITLSAMKSEVKIFLI